MKRYWLLSGFLSVFLFAAGATAGELSIVRFDENRNMLEFSTDEDVQPRAQLVTNPTRLVIDLPGIQLRSRQPDQLIGGAIQNIRFGQADRNTARIVVEMAPGYTLDPQGVKFRGISPTEWTVQLPEPHRDGAPAVSSLSRSAPSSATNSSASSVNNQSPIAQSSSRLTSSSSSPTSSASATEEDGRSAGTVVTQVDGIEFTDRGIFVRTSGGTPDISINRFEARDSIEIDIENATISSRLSQRLWAVGRFNIERLEVEPRNRRGRSEVRITLSMRPGNHEYDIKVRDLSGVGIYPENTSYRTFRASVANPSADPSSGLSQMPDAAEPGIPEAPPAGSPLSSGQTTEPPPSSSGQRPLLTLPPRSPASQQAIEQLQRLNQRRPGQRPGAPLPRVRDGRLVVVIDPGHGGGDPGAVGIGNLHEADVVIDVAQQVASLLEQQGVQVVMTRNSDVEVDLEPRVVIAEQANADLFVSIHANAISMDRPDINGLETYYYSSGEGLAETIHETILQSIPHRDRGVRQARFYVLRRTSMPATLVEIGFVTGEEDAPRLATGNFRSQMAEAIARGILNYIQQNSLRGNR